MLACSTPRVGVCYASADVSELRRADPYVKTCRKPLKASGYSATSLCKVTVGWEIFLRTSSISGEIRSGNLERLCGIGDVSSQALPLMLTKFTLSDRSLERGQTSSPEGAEQQEERGKSVRGVA